MATDPADRFDLQRFVDAQQRDYRSALAELEAGSKRSHWIWYVLPQLRGLGSSGMAQTYGIASLAEARAYLAHPLLGSRLRACVTALRRHHGRRSAEQILGGVDAMKFRSCLTLFAAADDEQPSLFDAALDDFFGGAADPRTLERLGRADD